MPTISVIVPVYRVEEYLRPCVDSILAQTFPDFELILVDDGSPDRCGAICDEYAAGDSRVRVIHQPNGGLSAARNAGLDAMGGEYVTFVDSDDVLHPACLARLYALLTELHADISVADYQRFDGEVPSSCEADPAPALLSGREACAALSGEEAVRFTSAWGKLFTAELFASLRFPVGWQHEDEATTYKALYGAGRVCAVGEKLYFYRTRPGSIMTSSFSVRRYDAILALKERAAFFAAHGEEALCQAAEAAVPVWTARLYIFAEHAGKTADVPPPYRMTERAALNILRSAMSDERYTWYLSLVHPKWLLPHAYLRKLKKLLHIPCP